MRYPGSWSWRLAVMCGFGCSATPTPWIDRGLTVIGEGVVSTRAIEASGTLTPDGTTLIFARRSGSWGGNSGPGRLYESRWADGMWSEPRPLPFSGAHDDGDPFLDPDGTRMFFTRRLADAPGQDHDIWVVTRTGEGWGDPHPLPEPVNSPHREYSPTVSIRGTLFFASTRPEGLGQGDLYVTHSVESGYAPPENLGSGINSPTGEWNVLVAPDEQLLFFEASGRPTNQSVSGDLYVSHRQGDAWGPPVPLSAINTTESELNPRITPDGAHLIFARSVREADDHAHADLFVLPLQQVMSGAARQP